MERADRRVKRRISPRQRAVVRSLLLILLISAASYVSIRWVQTRAGVSGSASHDRLLDAEAGGAARKRPDRIQSGKDVSRLILSGDWERYGREAVERYLDEAGRTPETLAVAFFLSHLDQYLDELEQHPDSPVACQTQAIWRKGPEARLRWAEQLRIADPDNALGTLLSARALKDLGRVEEAAEVFMAAIRTPGFATGRLELERNYLDALAIVESDPIRRAAIALNNSYHLDRAVDFADREVQHFLASLETTAPESRLDAANAVLGWINAITRERDDSKLGSADLCFAMMERRALEVLPAENIVDVAAGTTASARIEELNQQIRNRTTWTEIQERLADSSAEVATEFFMNVGHRGVRRAAQRLIERTR